MDRSTTIELAPIRAVGVGMLAVAVAAPLVPVPAGLPCPLRTMTGIPCPLCGMTRSVTALMHGDLGASIAFTPAGVVAVLAAVAILVAWRRREVRIPLWGITLALALMWGYQMFKYTTGRPL